MVTWVYYSYWTKQTWVPPRSYWSIADETNKGHINHGQSHKAHTNKGQSHDGYSCQGHTDIQHSHHGWYSILEGHAHQHQFIAIKVIPIMLVMHCQGHTNNGCHASQKSYE